MGKVDSTNTTTWGIDVKARDVPNRYRSDGAREMSAVARDQQNLLINMSNDGSLDAMLTDVENGQPIDDTTWAKLINPVSEEKDGNTRKSIIYDQRGIKHEWKHSGSGMFDKGVEVGPMMLLAPGDLDRMVSGGAIDPDEAEALKVLRGVYLATGSKTEAETALQNFCKLNDEDKTYFVNHLYSPDVTLTGQWDMTDGDSDGTDDIRRISTDWNELSASQKKDRDNMVYLLTQLDPETYEALGNADEGVICKLAGSSYDSVTPFNSKTFVENLGRADLPETDTAQLTAIETRVGVGSSYSGELYSLTGTEKTNLTKIIGDYADSKYGFAATYSGIPESKTSTTLMMSLGVESATQIQVVQLQQLLDKTSLDPSQKENVFNYFVSNGQNTDTDGAGEAQLDEDLNAFLNDPAVNGTAEDWMEKSFALAKVQTGDTKSAWTLRAEAGAADPATGCTAAQTIEGDPKIGDPIIGPGNDPTRNPSLILYRVLSGTASQEELDAAINKTKYGLWDVPPLPDPSTIPYAAKIQMDADSLTEDQERVAAKIYDVISGASTIPVNKKQALFSYILTGGKEPEQSADMDALVATLKTDPSVTSKEAALIDAVIGGTPYYQPDQLQDSYVTDKVWAGFAQNGEGFNGDTYTQVDVTQENARAALDHMDGLGLSADDLKELTDRMVNKELTEPDITLLNAHAKDTTLEPGDRDVILSAISNSDGVVPIPSNADKGFKDADIDTAFSHLNFGGTNYTQEDIAQLKKAAKEGTMTPDQVALLMVNSSQGTLTPDDKVTLLSACDYSHRTAYAKHGAQWEAEVEANNDDNGDGVIGDPYEDAMSPDKCRESGMGYDQIVDLGSLFFEVMVDRMESLDSTVRSYADAVDQKNRAISNMNAALACVPPEPAGDNKTVDISNLSFTFKYKVKDPETGETTEMTKPMKLTDYLDQQGISLPSADGSTSLDATQLSSLRQSMSNKATSWGSDSTLAAAQFQNAMSKYNTCVSQLSSFLPKWYDMCTKAFTGR